MSQTHRRVRRPLAALAATVVALPLAALSALPAAAATPHIRDITRFACNPNLVPDPGFVDITAFVPEIRCLAGYGITKGTPDDTHYSPDRVVSRAEMAVFVYRLGQYAGVQFDTSDAGFTDISSQPASFQEAINALAHKKIVNGVTLDHYQPGGSVTRGQMASFLNRLEGVVAGAKFTTSQDYFSDDNGTTHQADINGIASAGIVGGTSSGGYNPAGTVNRQAMAAFLVRYTDAAIDLGLVPSLFPSGAPAFTTPDSAEQVVEYGTSKDSRDYTVTVDKAKTVSIALLPAAQVRTDGSFSSTAVDSSGNAAITKVNGAAPSSSGEQVDSVTPGDTGTVTFTVQGTGMAQLVPVVWADLGAKPDQKLDTAAGGFPTEPYVAAGRLDSVPAEAATSTSAQTVTVVDQVGAVNPRIGYFVGTSGTAPLTTTATYYYHGASDTYGYNGSPLKTGITDFEGMLTRTDVLSVTYNQDQSKQSVFNVTTDKVPPASEVVATAGDFNGDGLSSDVKLTWTPSTQADATYDVYADTNSNGTPDSGEQVQSGVTGDTVTLSNVSQGTYTYLVVAKGASSGSTSSATPSNAVTVPVPPPAVIHNGAVLIQNKGFPAADAGDVMALYFNRPVTLNSAPAIQVSGANNTGNAVLNSADATFTLNSAQDGLSTAGEILTITLTKGVYPSGGSAALQYPLTITGASGVSANTQSWFPSASTDDVSIDMGPAQFIRDTAVVGQKTFTISFNQPVDPSTATSQASYSYNQVPGLPIASIQLLADGRTVKITLQNAVAKGDTIQTTQNMKNADNSQTGPNDSYTVA